MYMKNLKNKFLKIACVTMALGLAVTGFNCGGSTPSATYEIWGAPATEKILQDKHIYKDIKSLAKIDLDSAKGEYETAQIVITADGNIDSYTVKLSDLVLDGETTVYDKENITVYNAKYLKITSTWTYDAIAGSYPDCLLPFDKAVEYGENKIADGNNQSIYFSFNVPLTQPAGLYKGDFEVTINGKTEVIPVTLNVRNVEVSQKVNARSFFINTWSYYIGEYESSQEMLDRYAKKLFEYRLAPTSLVNDIGYGEDDAKYYVEKAYELCANDSCSTIGIPCRKTNGIPDGEFTMWLVTFAEKCLETNYDLLDKCYVYGIDEPGNGEIERLKKFYNDFMSQRYAAVEQVQSHKAEYMAKYDFTEEFFNQIIASIEGVRFVTTAAYREAFAPYVDLWCPQYNTFENGLATGVYDNDERWFYGAVSPRNPYPNYHLDNIALSPRMIGWLQAIYNVTGNLYWATNIYADWKDDGYAYPDDYYSDPSHYSNANGDGFLFYPGKKYGIEGPIPSLRIDAIRDGQEEFELLYAIKEYYKQISAQTGVPFTADSTLADISSALYVGTQITATTETFNQARKQLLNLSEFTANGICFTNYKDNNEGLITYSLFVPTGKTLNVDGATQQGNPLGVTGGKIVTYTVDLTKTHGDKVVFSTEIDGKTVSVERQLSGEIAIFTPQDLVESFNIAGDTETKITSIVDGTAIAGENVQLLSLILSENFTNVRLENEDLLAKLKKLNKVVFNFYSETDGEVKVDFIWKTKKGMSYQQTIKVYTFTKGKNVIEWTNLSSKNWDNLDSVSYLAFKIGDKDVSVIPEIYLKNVVLYADSGVAL